MVAAATISQPNRPSRHFCARPGSKAEGYWPSGSMAESYARVTAHLHKQYVWGLRYIDAPVLRDRETDGGSAGLDERLYYTQDGNFNVTALINTDGTVAERIIYSPYGQPTFLKADWTPSNGPDGQDGTADDGTASDYHNAILYCGYRFDSETGLYHVRHRYLHPTLGRWTTQDPLGYVDGANLYEYCSSQPSKDTDPKGLTPWTDRRTTKSVQEWVGAPQTGQYDGRTCEGVTEYQRALMGWGYLNATTPSGKPNPDGKWGDQTETAHQWYLRCKQYKRARDSALEMAKQWNETSCKVAKIWGDSVQTYLSAEAWRSPWGFVWKTHVTGEAFTRDINKMREAAWSTYVDRVAKNRTKMAEGRLYGGAYYGSRFLIKLGYSSLKNDSAGVGAGARGMVATIAWAVIADIADDKQSVRDANLLGIAKMYVTASVHTRRLTALNKGYRELIKDECPSEHQD